MLMSTSEDAEHESIEESELQRQAYEAVESASKWLADRRRTAAAEEYQPYSDKYTSLAAGEEESGFMSSAEGMTALFQILSYVHDDANDVYFTPQVSDDILTFDVDWVLNEIEEGKFRATPYLPGDATDDFTDAVSFSTTTLQQALANEKVNIDDERIVSALEDITDWFLDNYRQSLDDHDGVGWAWCGSSQMLELDREYPPQTYFTYSACIALTDIYRSDWLDYRKDEILDILSRAIKGLLSDYWKEGRRPGWTEFTTDPYGNGLKPNSYNSQLVEADPDIFSTSNTLMATAYMWNYLPQSAWENANLSQEELDRIEAGIDHVLESVSHQLEGGTLHENAAKYAVEALVSEKGQEREVKYFDGTLPYTVMNALIEVGRADGPFDYRNDEVEEQKLKVIEYILEHCWDSNVGDIGFKHFDTDLKRQPVVTYATQVAIESLLGFELKPPEEGVKIQVIKKLENTKAEISELLEDRSVTEDRESTDPAGDRAELVLSQSEQFTKQLLSARVTMETQFNDNYANFDGPLSKDVRTSASQLGDDDLQVELLEVNVENFLYTLNECYFATTVDEFQAAIDYFKEEYWIFTFYPQREAIEDLDSMDAEKIDSFDTRSQKIENIIMEFTEDVFRGHDPNEVGNEFNQRNFDI